MNYWPAEPADLAELHGPLFDLVDQLACHRRRIDADALRRRGFVLHHNTDIWADTVPLDGVYCGLWPTGAAWLTFISGITTLAPDDEFLGAGIPGDEARRRSSASTT